MQQVRLLLLLQEIAALLRNQPSPEKFGEGFSVVTGIGARILRNNHGFCRKQ
jgi:hypothetical protein